MDAESRISDWRMQLAFEIATAVLTISNALDQPYRERVEIMQRLKRDGILSFLVGCSYLGIITGRREIHISLFRLQIMSCASFICAVVVRRSLYNGLDVAVSMVLVIVILTGGVSVYIFPPKCLSPAHVVCDIRLTIFSCPDCKSRHTLLGESTQRRRTALRGLSIACS